MGLAHWGREGLVCLMKPEGTECLEDFTENSFTLGAGGGVNIIFKKGFSFKGKSILFCFAEIMGGFERTGGSGDFREGEENREMISTESG